MIAFAQACVFIIFGKIRVNEIKERKKKIWNSDHQNIKELG
jgi:hypothetical protein